MMDYWKQEKYDHTTLKEKNLRDTIALMEAELGREAGKVDPASLVWATFRSHERREANADTPERWIPYRGAQNKVNGKM